MAKITFKSREFEEFKISVNAAQLFEPKDFKINFNNSEPIELNDIPSWILEMMVSFAEDYAANPFLISDNSNLNSKIEIDIPESYFKYVGGLSQYELYELGLLWLRVGLHAYFELICVKITEMFSSSISEVILESLLLMKTLTYKENFIEDN